MKHLKLFNENKQLEANSNWEPYVIELFEKYMKMIEDDGYGEQDIEITGFFDSLQEEIDNSEELDIWQVTTFYGDSFSGKTRHFLGLVRAYGELHASIKMALEFRDPEIIVRSESFVPEEEEIESHINRLKQEIEKWTKIY